MDFICYFFIQNQLLIQQITEYNVTTLINLHNTEISFIYNFDFLTYTIFYECMWINFYRKIWIWFEIFHKYTTFPSRRGSIVANLELSVFANQPVTEDEVGTFLNDFEASLNVFVQQQIGDATFPTVPNQTVVIAGNLNPVLTRGFFICRQEHRKLPLPPSLK